MSVLCGQLEKLNFQSYLKNINKEGIAIITPNIANIIANDVNIPNKTVGIKLDKVKIENPNAIVVEVVKTAKPADELVSFIESINLLSRLNSLKRYK